jgi:agmatinase
LLRPYNPALEVEPFAVQQVVDAGDIACNPFDITAALGQIETGARALAGHGTRLMTLGGDHTIALPLLRVMAELHGRVAVLHFDAHLDTWDTYFGAPYTHGTPFRRASEEGLIDPDHSLHVGTRGPLYAASDLSDTEQLGYGVISCTAIDRIGPVATLDAIRSRLGQRPVYVSIDIDVLDPAHAPGTGTPEAGGMTSRELLGILRGLNDLQIVSADVVEVAPPYDHAEITGIAAAHVSFELISLMASRDGLPAQ